MSQPLEARKREHGQIIVLFVLALIVIMGAAALVIDVGVLRNANQNLWNALDAGALAGASKLPANDAKSAKESNDLALEYVAKNYPGGLSSVPDLTVGYRCVIDVGVAGSPDLSDVPASCDPGPGAVWTCNATKCSAVCEPTNGDTCNTIVLESTATVPYNFGPAVGVETGTTQEVLSAACMCDSARDDRLDLVLIVDRTQSMTDPDMVNAKDAARSLLTHLDPASQHVAFGVLGPSDTTTSCGSPNSPATGLAGGAADYGSAYPADVDKWIPVGLTGTGAAPVNESYLNADGTVNNGSLIVKTINCINHPGGTGTNLSTPIKMARQYLLSNGRPGVLKAILLETDGQPNFGAGTPADYTCSAAKSEADLAKAAKIEILTVGFGVDHSNGCPDSSGPYVGKPVTKALADMAGADDDGCVAEENTDGDNFFCQPKSEDLESVFVSAVTTIIGKPKLIDLP